MKSDKARYLSYLSERRKKWPPGPWDDEPDREEWIDETTGLACLLWRHPHRGCWNGYVGLPKGHPYFGEHGEDGPLGDIEVHDLVTYTGPPSDAGGDPSLWWVGFSCSRWNDYLPGFDDHFDDQIYRDMAFAKEECRKLAEQLAALAR